MTPKWVIVISDNGNQTRKNEKNVKRNVASDDETKKPKTKATALLLQSSYSISIKMTLRNKCYLNIEDKENFMHLFIGI